MCLCMCDNFICIMYTLFCINITLSSATALGFLHVHWCFALLIGVLQLYWVLLHVNRSLCILNRCSSCVLGLLCICKQDFYTFSKYVLYFYFLRRFSVVLFGFLAIFPSTLCFGTYADLGRYAWSHHQRFF